MNVVIKPLVWDDSGDGIWEAKSPFGWFAVFRQDGRTDFTFSLDTGRRRVDGHDSLDSAKIAAERWYTAKVLDCLEPADKATCAEFVALYAQCNGEYD